MYSAGNGILSIDGTMNVQNCEFTDAGIECIKGYGTNFFVTQNHFDGRSQMGVFSNNNLNAEWVNIVRDNIFDMSNSAWRNAILLDRSQATGTDDMASHNFISDNDFNISDTAQSLYCIQVRDLVSASDELYVTNNDISVESVGPVYGIWATVSNSNGIKIIDNEINYTNASPFGSFGVYLQGSGLNPNTSKNHTVQMNTITGQSTSSLQCAVHSVNVQNIEYCENTVDYSLWGLHFVGQNDVALRENRIRHHERGIYIGNPLGSDHRIGEQKGRGNTWSDQSNDPNECTESSARVDYGNPLKSMFLIVEADSMPYLPPANKINPMIPVWIFYTDTISEDHCEPTYSSQVKLMPYEKELVDNVSALDSTELWDLTRKVYLKLLLNPSLRPSGSAEETFFNSLSGSVIDSLAQVQQQIIDALNLPDSTQEDFDMYRGSIFAALDSLSILDSAKVIRTDTSWSSAYFPNRATLLQIIADNAIDEQTLESGRNLQLTTALQNARTQNSQISASYPWEIARKTLNEIYIRRLLGETLTDTSYEEILDLANADVFVAGEAVNDAVLFLAPCDQVAFMGQEGETEDRSAGLIVATEQPTDLRIIPNPSNGYIKVEAPMDFTGSVIIMNTAGQKVNTAIIEKAGVPVQFQLENQAAGLYWLLLSTPNGHVVASRKFVLIH